MRGEWRRLSLLTAGAAVAALAVATPASASIANTAITTPAGAVVYHTYDGNSATNTFAIAGTTDSNLPATDKVDILCYYGGISYPQRYHTVATNVPLASNGTFSLPAAALGPISYSECRLRAVPAGADVGANRASFRGPLMLTSGKQTYLISGGPNDGKAYTSYYYGQQDGAAIDYESAGYGGLWDSYLFGDGYGQDTTVFYANAWLWKGNLDGSPFDTRSEIQVDGHDAYPAGSAVFLFSRTGACPPTCDGSQDNPGFPSLTSSFTQSPTTGDVVIRETDTFARCTSNPTYPPTHATCTSFSSTGVRLNRTFVQDHTGHVSLVTDNFSSTDGQQHAVDLLYENAQYLNRSYSPNVGYRFAGESSYATHAQGATVTVPDRPDTIYIKNIHAADGDPNAGQGAITYSVAPTLVRFISPPTYSDSNFTMQYAGTVPASGNLTYRFGYSTDFTTAAVTAEALDIQHSFTPCVVPKLKGKTVSQARTALTTAYCSLGKIKKAFSKKVKKRRIISTNPAAGVTKPYGTPVNLKVSKGRKH